ncbi:LuxR C-terminal-related transcriptional regulator [Actinomadura nitritigenes]|uniref:helix-turn-helix transcriptional regulator n=1 Tax=Actinomadura nitritigenes TaxID=134602 RepID=UPI003D8B5AD9
MSDPRSPLRTNLPAEPNAFVGRERDVADLRRLLEGMRAVTLCGAGGIGKTRLALHVARTMLDAHPDGVWLVELAGVRADGTPEPVARRVAAVLDVAEEEGRRTADTLADALRGPSVLIVLDNCEHVIEECAELTGLLLARCPRMRVLATSREPLRMAGENVWRVPPLEPHEAVRLFADRARAARPGFDVTGGVEEVTRALDGMPLALELAAARVRVLSVEQMAGRLADRFRLLSAGDRTAPPRQRTLRAAIDWSHDLLDERERTLLRRLSVFAGWTLEQAEHVCADAALPAEDVLDLLTALVDKSLVAVAGEMAGQVRFHQLDSIREYAAERLAEAGEDAEFRNRHRDAVLEDAERHGRLGMAEVPGAWADRVALFRRYDAELGNVQAALTWSLDRGDIGKGLRLCTALRTFWIVRGRVAEWADWTDRFLGRSHGTDPRILGAALAGRAQLAVGGRDFAQAARYAEEALGPCRAAGDTFATASALVTLAESLARAGRFTDAAQRLDEADAIAAGPGLDWVRAYARITRGYLLIRRVRLREAREHLDAGARLMREIGQLWGAAHAIIGLGRLAELRGDPGAARAHYADVLPILAEIGARPEMARALAGIGRVALEQRDVASAREALAESLSLSRSSGIRLDVARALETFAELVAVEGDARGAVTLAGAASALREATGRHPAAGARRERMLEPIRRRLGEPLVAQFWGEGRAMPPDDAVDYALHAHNVAPAPVPPPRRSQEQPRPPAPPTREHPTPRPTREPTTEHEPNAAQEAVRRPPSGSQASATQHPTHPGEAPESSALRNQESVGKEPGAQRPTVAQLPANAREQPETLTPAAQSVPRKPDGALARAGQPPASAMSSEATPESPTARRPKADRQRPNDDPADPSQGATVTRQKDVQEPSAAHVQESRVEQENTPGPAVTRDEDEPGQGAIPAQRSSGQDSGRRRSTSEPTSTKQRPAAERFRDEREIGAVWAQGLGWHEESGRQARSGESASRSRGPSVARFEDEQEPTANQEQQPSEQELVRRLTSADQHQQPGEREAGRQVTGSEQTDVSQGSAALPSEEEPRPGAVGAEGLGWQEQSEDRVWSARQEIGGQVPRAEQTEASPGSTAGRYRDERGPGVAPGWQSGGQVSSVEQAGVSPGPVAAQFGDGPGPGVAPGRQSGGRQGGGRLSSGERADASSGSVAGRFWGGRGLGAAPSRRRGEGLSGERQGGERQGGGQEGGGQEGGGQEGGGRQGGGRQIAADLFNAGAGGGRRGGEQVGGEQVGGGQVGGRRVSGGGPVDESQGSGAVTRLGAQGAAAWGGSEPEVGAGEGRVGGEMAAGQRFGVMRGSEEAGQTWGGRASGAGEEWEAGRDLLGGEQRGEARDARPRSGPGGGRALEGRARPFTPPSTLTGREREVARLVARGLTNRGIADELVISPATVARHVTNILTKLGYSSRAQIAAWVVETLSPED